VLGYQFGFGTPEIEDNYVERCSPICECNRHPMMKNKRMYMDTMFAKVKNIWQNTCAQVYTDGQGHSLFYPMWSRKDAPVTLLKMVHDMQDVPEIVVSDGSGEQTGRQWKKEVNLFHMKSHLMELYSHWQNHLEQEVGFIKTAIKWKMSRVRFP
jgi:hypothetical protein